MARYIGRRLLWMIPVVLGVAILIFTIMIFCPGDPAEIILGSGATDAELELKREMLGLNQPYLVRLGEYLKNVFLHFDFGVSYSFSQPVTSDLMLRIPRTLTVGILSIILSVLIGVPLGIAAAVHQNKLGDRLSMVVALVGVSMPSFWLGLMLVILFALNLRWLPPSGIDSWKCYILPVFANAMGGIATLARQTRSSMLDVIRSDYVVTARSKGVPERAIRYRHMLPNALIPIITVVGNNFGHMLGGAVVIETVFAIPGVGMYMINAVNSRDYPAVEGSVVLLAIAFSFVMLLVDILYAFVDPRIKAQYSGGSRRRKSHV